MAVNGNSKLKLLFLLKIFQELTDEEHPITMTELICELGRQGIKTERKSMYGYIEDLQLFGVDIIFENNKGYYIASRDFELPELKLLVDSVQASKFITKKKSLELISKLEGLTSRPNAGKLRRQVFVSNRVKTVNEKIYYTVDTIYEAISENKQISFRYFEWTVDKTEKYRKNGEMYVENPISLSWDDENYYLITYKPKYGGFTHYRVDKMTDLSILESNRELPPDGFDTADYSKKIFGMFGGAETAVEVKFDNSLAGVVIDRFGMETPMLKDGESCFRARLNVAISPQFIGWLMGFGTKAEVVSPESLRKQIKDYVKSLIEIYS